MSVLGDISWPWKKRKSFCQTRSSVNQGPLQSRQPWLVTVLESKSPREKKRNKEKPRQWKEEKQTRKISHQLHTALVLVHIRFYERSWSYPADPARTRGTLWRPLSRCSSTSNGNRQGCKFLFLWFKIWNLYVLPQEILGCSICTGDGQSKRAGQSWKGEIKQNREAVNKRAKLKRIPELSKDEATLTNIPPP